MAVKLSGRVNLRGGGGYGPFGLVKFMSRAQG